MGFDLSVRIILLVTFYCVALICGQDVTVTTNIGTIIGEVHRSSFNRTPVVVSRFLGIPFAEPPIGDRRFHRPVKKAAFTDPFIAKSVAPQCWQNNSMPTIIDASEIIQSEDCLYLNILMPGATIDTAKNWSVMIWIYGGRFQVGSQDIYTSSTFAAINDVILVTMNYRVSVFGFLSTGENNLSGNYGLWDQHMAIQWVHDHIEKFGGDPMRVTIFGESAGGVSVTYQALYDGNEDLFQRVIAQSGTVNLVWAMDKTPRVRFAQLVNNSDCIVGTLRTMIECLRNKTAPELLFALGDIRFAPVFDGEFVKLRPSDILQNNTDKASEILSMCGKYDFIFGLTSAEGALSIGYFDYLLSPEVAMIDPAAGYTLEAFENNVIPFLFSLVAINDMPDIINKAIVHNYVDWKATNNRTLMRLKAIDLLSDLLFNAGIISSAKSHADTNETGHTFFFVYDHQNEFLPGNRGYNGAAHGEELPVLFGLDENILSIFLTEIPDDPAGHLSENDVLLSRQLMEYWTNFAKTGFVQH